MFQNVDMLINESVPEPIAFAPQSMKCRMLGVSQETIDNTVLTTVKLDYSDFDEFDRRRRLPELLLINRTKYENNQSVVKDISPVVFVLEANINTRSRRYFVQLTSEAQDRLRALFLDNYLVLRAYVRAHGRGLGAYSMHCVTSSPYTSGLLGGSLQCSDFYVVNMFILGEPYDYKYTHKSALRADTFFRMNGSLSRMLKEAIKTVNKYDMEQSYAH